MMKKDNMTLEIVNLILDMYNKKIKFNYEINKLLSIKKIRNENFPSEISENIVKFVFRKKYKITGNWDTKNGDLQIINKKIEIKGFSSKGPLSFGPTEKWDILCIVDATKSKDKIFIVYLINLSNINNFWRNIKVNKIQTFDDQCLEKRRPRICFDELKKQLKSFITIIFNGHIDDLK